MLKSGNLYYDAGYSQRPPRSHWGRMDSLVSIKHFIFEAYVWQDSEYGLAIYPDYWKKNYALLPGLGMPCEIILDGIRSEFRVAEIGTRMPDTIKSTQEGEWNAEDYREGTVRIVYCPTSPDSLRSWLDGYFEVDQLLEEERKSVPFLGGGISIFVEVLEAGRAYSIRPAIHFHPYHVRDKSVLED
ncbi:MAG: hypothetical protein MUO81_00445 [Thermoplasmata archaeon]|nr:hypothetical protein [Thermoplasmata archaeon]